MIANKQTPEHATEAWLPIPGSRYQVSNRGQVMNPGGRILKPFPGDRTGHLRVVIEGRNHFVHRLVALAFLGEGEGEVCHNDNDPTNNDVSNLRWGSRSSNVRDLRQQRTACPSGHEFTPENTYIEPSTGWRRCRTCKRNARAR